MHSPTHYLLIAPLGMAFLSLGLCIAAKFDRHQPALQWMGWSMLASSLGLGVQSVLPPGQIAQYAVYTAVLYLVGAWLLGRSLGEKFHAPYPRTAAALVAALTLGGIYYFSQIQDHLTARACVLSMGLGILQILPLANVLRYQPREDKLELVLYVTYLLFCLYTVLRPLSLLVFGQVVEGNLVQSVYWFVTLLGSILFCMGFTLLFLATSMRRAFQQLHLERNQDPLTDLLNRRAFEEYVARHLQDRHALPATVVMCDLDFFKNVNDRWGHAYGDQVLRNAALCLRQGTRTHDLVARFGGEEFVLLLPDTDLASARQVVQRIQAQLAQAPYQLPNHKALTFSVGMASWQPSEPVTAALQRADQALYQAKQAGRNRICTV